MKDFQFKCVLHRLIVTFKPHTFHATVFLCAAAPSKGRFFNPKEMLCFNLLSNDVVRARKISIPRLTLQELIEGARVDATFQSRLRVMDIDETLGPRG